MARSPNLLKYNASPVSRATVRRQYLRLRTERGTPLRCDNPECQFHRAALVWNEEDVGIVIKCGDEVFLTIEGNTNDEGSREGYEVCRRIRGYGKKDFIRI